MTNIRTIFVALLIPAATSASVDPGLLGLVMPDAKVLSGLQVGQSQASPFGQYLLKQLPVDNDALAKFISATGFDPRRDLREIVSASAGPINAAPGNHGTLILLRGTFQPGRAVSTALAAGASVTNHSGIDIVASQAKQGTGALAFLDNSTAVMGDFTVVAATIDRRQAGTIYSGALADKAKDVSANNDAWFATLTPLSELLKNVGQNNIAGSAPGNFLQTIIETSGGLTFGATEVTVSGDAVTQSPEDAQALVNVMHLLGSMVQASPQKDPRGQGLAWLVEAAKISAEGPVIHLMLSLPEQQVEQLMMQGRRTRKIAQARPQ